MLHKWKQLPRGRSHGLSATRALSISPWAAQRWLSDRMNYLKMSLQTKLQWRSYLEQRFLVTYCSTASLVLGLSYIYLSANERMGVDYDQALWKAFPRLTSEGKQILIPPQRPSKLGWKTLVLDMDEMLVGNTTGMKPKDATPFIPFADGSFSHIHRPNLKTFLEYASANFEVVLWTAGTKGYAAECIHNMLRVHSLPTSTFDHIIARDSSWFQITQTSWYSKDLSQLDRPIENVLMLENAPVVKPSSNAIIVADYQYPFVSDTHAVSRERNVPERIDIMRSLRASLTQGSMHLRTKKEALTSPIQNSTATVVPCTSVSSREDATLFTAHEIVKRWKQTTKSVADFLRDEMKSGVLFQAHIRPPRKNVAEPMATLPLHRQCVNAS